MIKRYTILTSMLQSHEHEADNRTAIVCIHNRIDSNSPSLLYYIWQLYTPMENLYCSILICIPTLQGYFSPSLLHYWMCVMAPLCTMLVDHSSITSRIASRQVHIGRTLAHSTVLLNDSAALDVRLLKGLIGHIDRAHLWFTIVYGTLSQVSSDQVILLQHWASLRPDRNHRNYPVAHMVCIRLSFNFTPPCRRSFWSPPSSRIHAVYLANKAMLNRPPEVSS